MEIAAESNMPPFNTKQAASVLGISHKTLNNWRHLGLHRELKPFHVGRNVYYPREAVRNFYSHWQNVGEGKGC